jgi:hypothetical protein
LVDKNKAKHSKTEATIMASFPFEFKNDVGSLLGCNANILTETHLSTFSVEE